MHLTNLLALLTATDVTTDFREVITSWGQVALSLSAIATALWGALRFFVLKPLDRRIAEATKQIQPNANGGQSLSDVNKKVDRLEEGLADLGERLTRIEEQTIDMYGQVLDALTKPKPTRKRKPKADDDTVE